MPARQSKRTRTLVESDEEVVEPEPTPIPASRSAGKGKAPVAPASTATPTTARAARERGNSSANDALGLPPDVEETVAKEPSKKAAKAKKKRVRLDELFGFDALSDGGKLSSSSSARKRDKPVHAECKLGVHQQGEKKGQYSGRVFFSLNCDFAENKGFAEVVDHILKVKPQWFKDWTAWGVRTPTKTLALKLFHAIQASEKTKVTARRMNKTLDVSAYDHPSVVQYNFTLATSELQFETRADGILPRSIMIIGQTYEFKEFLKERFPTIRYTDLVFNGGKVTKAAWVLPVADQTDETGSLTDFLTSLGVTVSEVDLDEGEDEDDDADRDEDGFVDDEAEESEGEEDDE